MRSRSIGGRELELLRWLGGRPGATVGEAAESFGAEQSLARSTVLTMMERLRAKGMLRRRRIGGLYRYEAVRAPEAVARGAVSEFVERTLGGSIAPFVAYLSESDDLDDEQLAELERLVDRLRERREDEP